MDEALNLLKTTVDDQEFIRLTKTVLRIIQNLLNDPENAKFRTVRAACKVLKLITYINAPPCHVSLPCMCHAGLFFAFCLQYVQKSGVSQLLEAVGFKLKVSGS